MSIPPYSVALIFPKSTSTPRLGSTRWLTFMITNLALQDVISSRIFGWCCLKFVYPTMVGENFRIYVWFSDYWKKHLQVKKLNLDICTHAASGKTLPQVQPRCPVIKTTGWFQGRLSFSYFRGQSNKYLEFLGT